MPVFDCIIQVLLLESRKIGTDLKNCIKQIQFPMVSVEERMSTEDDIGVRYATEIYSLTFFASLNFTENILLVKLCIKFLTYINVQPF